MTTEPCLALGVWRFACFCVQMRTNTFTGLQEEFDPTQASDSAVSSQAGIRSLRLVRMCAGLQKGPSGRANTCTQASTCAVVRRACRLTRVNLQADTCQSVHRRRADLHVPEHPVLCVRERVLRPRAAQRALLPRGVPSAAAPHRLLHRPGDGRRPKKRRGAGTQTDAITYKVSHQFCEARFFWAAFDGVWTLKRDAALCI